MADTQIIIGGVALSDWEIPEEINFGGEQTLKIHTLIGGTRFLDAMGDVPAPFGWKGWFRGPDALPRARLLDEMRRAGAQIDLSWFDFFDQVVIRKFEAKVHRFYEISYEITCEIATNDSTSAGALSGGLDSLVSADLLSASNAASLAPVAAQAAVASVQTAVGAAGGLDGATNAVLSGALSVASGASATLNGLSSSADAQIATTPGMVAGSDPADMATWLIGQAQAVQTESAVIDVTPYVDRIAINVASAGF